MDPHAISKAMSGKATDHQLEASSPTSALFDADSDDMFGFIDDLAAEVSVENPPAPRHDRAEDLAVVVPIASGKGLAGIIKQMYKKTPTEISRSIQNLSEVLDCSKVDTTRLLLEDEEISTIADDWIKNYHNKMTSDYGNREKGVEVERIINMLLEHQDRRRLQVPSGSQLRDFTPDDWQAHLCWKMGQHVQRLELVPSGEKSFNRDMALRVVIVKGFLLLRARVYLVQNERKMRQAVSALKKATKHLETAQARRLEQDKASAKSNTWQQRITLEATKESAGTRSSRQATSSSSPSLQQSRRKEQHPADILAGDLHYESLQTGGLTRQSTRVKHTLSDGTLVVRDETRVDPRHIGIQPPKKPFDYANLDVSETIAKLSSAQAQEAKSDEQLVRLEKKAAKDKLDTMAKFKALKTRNNGNDIRDYVRCMGFVRGAVASFFDQFEDIPEIAEHKDRCIEVMQSSKRQEDTALGLHPQILHQAKNNSTSIRVLDDYEGDSNINIGSSLQKMEARCASSVGAGGDEISVADLLLGGDLPEVPEHYRQQTQDFNSKINGREYQCDAFREAMQYCMTSQPDRLSVPNQSPNISLRWWQLISVYWAHMVTERGYTKGGIIADAIGLGKTMEYGGLCAMDIYFAEKRYREAPQGMKPLCRPIYVLTLPGLIMQTIKDIRRHSNHPHIVVLHSGLDLQENVHTTVVRDISKHHFLRNTANQRNLRTIVVTSYDTFASQFGPSRHEKWRRQRDEAAGRKFVPYKKGAQIQMVPEYPHSPAGLARLFVLDEPHITLRNTNTHWQTIQWANADQVWMYTGSPIPRGLEDMASYMGLLSHAAVEAEAKVSQPQLQYNTHTTNPYLLPDDHLATKYRYTRYCFDKWIVQGSHESEYDRGVLAGSTMRMIVLRRDYGSGCPIGAAPTIAEYMPPLTHFCLDLVMSPTSHLLMMRAIDDWRSRMFIIDRNSVRKYPMPNPRALRALALVQLFPPLQHLNIMNPHYSGRLDDEKTDEETIIAGLMEADSIETNQSYFSWFEQHSTLFKNMPDTGRDLQRWRWLLKTIVDMRSTYHPCEVDVATKAWADSNVVSDKEVIEEILKFSPKLTRTIELLVRHCMMDDDKVIVWFRYRSTLELVQELLQAMPFFSTLGKVNGLVSETTGPERTKMQHDMNDPTSGIRVLLMSLGVGAVGFNFQHDSHVQIHFEQSDTIEQEAQAIGRQQRMEQLYPVTVYSFMIYGSLDKHLVDKMLSRATAGFASLMSHDFMGDAAHIERVKHGETKLVHFDDCMAGYFEHKDEESGQIILLHRNSMRGEEAVKKERTERGNSEWEPHFLDAADALHRLMRTARAHSIRQHGGFGITAISDLSHFVEEQAYLIEKKLEAISKVYQDQHGTMPAPDTLVGVGDDAKKLETHPTDPLDPALRQKLLEESGFKLDSIWRPRLEGEGIAHPTDEEWETMTEEAKRKILALIRRQEANWQVKPEHKYQPPKPKRIRKSSDSAQTTPGSRRSKRLPPDTQETSLSKRHRYSSAE